MSRTFCRTCLINYDITELQSVFSLGIIKQNRILLSDMLYKCTGLKLTEYDKHSTSICRSCVIEISRCYSFRLLSLDSDAKLNEIEKKDILNELEVKKEIATVDNLNINEYLNEEHNFLECEIKVESLEYDYTTDNTLPETTNQDSVEVSNFQIEEHNLNNEDKQLDYNTAENSINKTVLVKKNGLVYRKLCTGTGIKKKTYLFECPICLKLLSNTCGLRQHIETHNTENKYLCEKCGDKFTSFSKYREHNYKHIGKYKCDQCLKTFPSKSQLDMHLIIHTGEKPHKCDLCDARFTQKSTIKVHKNIVHSDKRPYQCKLCASNFKLNSKLLAHMKSHSTDKPFKCHICYKEFNRKERLKEHVQIHSTERKYKCEECGKAFAVRKNLKQHENSHLRPYRCKYCNKRFSQSHCLKTHLKTHSAENKDIGDDNNLSFEEEIKVSS